MRTTLTLDDDVAALVEEAMRSQRRPMKGVVNDALREALGGARARQEEFRVDVHHSALMVGVDAARLNQLADDLADEAAIG